MIHRSLVRPARRRALLLGGAVAVLATGHARPALAAHPAARMHATLISSEPAKGSKIATSPARIYLVFSEEVEPSLGSIRLVGPGGRVVTLKPAGDPRNVSALVAPVPAPLDAGSWRVEWRIVSEDGHPIDGTFTFTVVGARSDTTSGAALPPPVVQPPPVDSAPLEPAAAAEPTKSAFADVPLLAATLRGLGVGFLTAFAGLLWFFGTRRDRALQPRTERLASSLAIGAAVTLVLHLFVWTLAVSPDRSLSGEHLSAMLISRVGRIEVARTALAVFGCWALVLARRDRLALFFALAAMAVSSATGHSAAIHPAWTIPMRALHLVAIALWLGGLLWLLSLDRSDFAAVGAEAQRVSSAAMFAVIAVTFSGIVQAKFFIGDWAEFVRSTYGYVALIKLAGLGVLVLFGAHHRYRVMPKLTEAGVVVDFARSLRNEVLVLSVVILIGGLLAYIPPPQH
ncbi:MAG: copper resistance CopC/CopD family protein [Gemmatimonadaceae bacterium]